MKQNLKRGFTLVELLIVMVILGILASIVASSFSSSQEKARDTRRKSDLASIAKALEVYFNDYDQYPASNNGQIDGYSWGDEFSDANGTVYMTKLPAEKTNARNYYYYSEGQNQSYALYARLENELDKDIPYNEATESYQYYQGTNCGSGPGCNYAISSSNISPDSFASITLTDE